MMGVSRPAAQHPTRRRMTPQRARMRRSKKHARTSHLQPRLRLVGPAQLQQVLAQAGIFAVILQVEGSLSRSLCRQH